MVTTNTAHTPEDDEAEEVAAVREWADGGIPVMATKKGSS